MNDEQIHFVTGRLAESALKTTLEEISANHNLKYTVQVMPITVAALMTPQWIAKRIEIPKGTERIILPGYCRGDLSTLNKTLSVPVELGPKDLRQLSLFLTGTQKEIDLSQHQIEIIAEINHVPELSVDEAIEIAECYIRDGADFVDVGCIPGQTCEQIGEYVQAIADLGVPVSIDSLNVREIEIAIQAGAQLVLSVNSSNREAAKNWGCEVIAIPDDPADLNSIEPTLELLEKSGVPFRIDPILEPIGLGFANSIVRYHMARQRWPDAEAMMGIGNLSELSDVDSAGVNLLLLGFCEELNIRSVLTTQVINWARSSVRECDIARRLVHHACRQQVPPKNLSTELVVLRDSLLPKFSQVQIVELAQSIKDHNYRILIDEDKLHLLGSGDQFNHADPFELFDELMASNPNNVDASHAFYLGYEMCKAMVAITLGKNYVQDEALDWGHLTVDEKNRHRLSKRYRGRPE